MPEISVTVRDLVAFCHRSGDIDHRFTPSPTGVQGVAGHQRVYRRRPDSYRSEYPVEYRHSSGELSLLLRGRADGYDPEHQVVEEIKTCRVLPDLIPEPVTRMHLAQARIYAAIIAWQENLTRLEVHLTWFNIDSGKEEVVAQHYSQAELAEFLEATLARFSHWLQALTQLRVQRDLSLASLSFPYGEFRAGQREIAELVYKCIDQSGQLMMEAPTGIGKTAAVLFPALKALGTGKHDRLVFVTAKTVGRHAAEETLRHFRDAGLRVAALSLTAKERICLSPGKACHGDDCPFARGYYDRLPAALAAAIDMPSLQRADIEALGRQFDICPYQLALDLLPWVDVVIADIHYVYSLTATLGSLAQQDERRWTVLLDEAHNLPERARRMYRSSLSKADLMAVKRDASPLLVPALGKINKALLALQAQQWLEPDYDSREQLPQPLLQALQEFVAVTGEQMAREPASLHRQPLLLDFYFAVLQFQRLADNWGEDFRFELGRNEGRQSLRLTLKCLDPARLLGERHAVMHAVTVFSATLSPHSWTRPALGLRPDAVFRRMESPFAPEQLQVYLATQVDTRFTRRKKSLPMLAQTLLQWLQQEPGNCIVYFPSYRYLQDCLEQLRRIGLEELPRSLWVQRPEQGDTGHQDLLPLLGQQRNVVAFCILGGVFGEGIDLPGEQLTSVAIVGVGLPQFNRDTEQLRAWYQQHHGAGFEFAYLYPGMLKVDQALGRVVRRVDDCGRALLIDSRYSERQYRELLPPWWNYQPWQAS